MRKPPKRSLLGSGAPSSTPWGMRARPLEHPTRSHGICATADVFLEESLAAAERAVALNPEDTGVIDTLAEVQFRLGRVSDAIATIDRAIALSPDDPYLVSHKERFEKAR